MKNFFKGTDIFPIDTNAILLPFSIQRFAESETDSSAGTLKLVGNIINLIGLKTLAQQLNDELKADKNSVTLSPALSFITSFLYEEADILDSDQTMRKTYLGSYATLITTLISTIDNACTIIIEFENEVPSKSKISSSLASIANGIGSIGQAIANINDLKINAEKNKFSTFMLPIATSGVALMANALVAIDGIDDEEKAAIEESYLNFLNTAGTSLVKEALSDAAAYELEKIKNGEGVVADALKKSKFFETASQTITKTIGIFYTLATSAITGINKYNATINKYREDGIPNDLAQRDAFIDAITVVIHDLASSYMKGFDDVIFAGTQKLVSWITGKKPGSQGNYVEVITDVFKAFNFINTGTEKADTLVSYINDTMVYGAGGDDYIGNIASNVQIYGGHDADTIISRLGSGDGYSTPQGNTIMGGSGRDFIIAYDNHSSFEGGLDVDKIAIFGSNNTIYGNDDTDFILIGENANSNIISGGIGDDVIIFEGGKNEIINYAEGDGNDIIVGYDESHRINIAGSYSVSTVDADVRIRVGTSTIILNGSTGKTININGKKIPTSDTPTNTKNDEVLILPPFWYDNTSQLLGTSGNDSIHNTLDSVFIAALNGNDTISNDGTNVTIDGGAGNDRIYNSRYGSNTSIIGGIGDDSIGNDGENATIDGGEGNDYIANCGDSVYINGGAGDDSIYSGDGNIKAFQIYNATINSGDGNDSIKNEGNFSFIDTGAGNDFVDNGSFRYQSSSNCNINVGDGNDTIWNDGNNCYFELGEGDDYIWSSGGSNNTIIGGVGDDYIGCVGRTTIIYLSGDGNDTLSAFDTEDTLKITGASYTTVTSGNNLKIIVGSGSILLKDVVASGIKLNIQGTLSDDTVSTVETAKNITNTKSNTIISGTKYADTISNLADNVTIDGGTDNDYIQNSGSNVTIIGGDGKDTIVATSSALTLTDFSSEDVITLIDSIKSISFDENSKTLKIDDKIVISLPNINVIKSSWTTSDNSVTYTPAQLPEFILAKNGKSITVAEGKASTPVTVSGLKSGLKVKDGSVSGIILNNKTFTLSESVLDKKEVTVSTGYTLALADDVITPKKSAAILSVSKGIATYKDGDTSAGYSVSNGKIVYSDAKEGDVLTKITGLKSDATIDGIKLSGKTVTLSASVLDKKDVTITNGYSLALADDVEKPVTDNITCSVTNGTVTYKGDKSAGYSSSGDKIVYSEKSTDETLTTINGLKNDATESSVSLKDDTVNISKTAIGTEPVTVNATNDVAKVVVEGAGNFVFGEQNFKVETAASFNLNPKGEVTSYQIESAGRLTNEVSKVSVIGCSGNDTISNTGDNVHVNESAGSNHLTNSGAKVTVTGAKGNDTVNNSGEGSLLNTGDGSDSITNSGNNVTINGGAGDDKISVTDKASNVTINVLEGKNIVDNYGSSVAINAGKDADNITNNGSNVTITAANGNDRVTNSGANVSIIGGEGNDTISNTGGNVTISGDIGTDIISLSGGAQKVTVNGGKDNDTIYSNGNSNLFRYSSGDGNDIIYNLGSNDTIQVASGNVDSIYAEKGGDVIVKIGSSNIRLKNKSGQTINIQNSAGKVTNQSYTYTEPPKPSSPTLTPTPSTPSTPNNTPNKSSTPSTNTSTKTSTTTPSTKPSSSSLGSSSSNSSSNHSSNSSSSNSTSSSSTTRPSSTNSSSNSWSSSSSNSNSTTWGSNSSSTRSSTQKNSSSSVNSSSSNGSTTKQNTTTPSITSTPIEKTSMAKSDGTTAIMYNYTGGHRKVANYLPEEKIQLSSDFEGIDVSRNNFVIKSSSGSLTIENVRDKVIDVAGTDGNTVAYVYMFSGEGFIDGTVADKYEVIVGSENAMNHLKAGNFGSSLIGGGGYTTLTSGASDDFMQGGTSQDTFVYTGGNDVIANYQSGEQVNFAATYTGWTTDVNNLVITAAEGSVHINDAQNKLIEVGDANGNLLAHVYQADGYEGIIDGRGFGAFEVIVGSDNVSNQIFADAAGSSLWGGRGNSNDDLYGNTGSDEYIYSYGNGNDNVFQAGNEDTVNLLNISLEQIASAEITDNGVIARFTDGSSLNINGQAGSFKLGSQTFHADYQNKLWS